MELARKVKAAGCGEDEARRLDAAVVHKKKCLWDDHTEQDTKLDILDQKAGDLLWKIGRHTTVLQKHDDAVEAARELVDKRIQERIEYANKLAELQASLGESQARNRQPQG